MELTNEISIIAILVGALSNMVIGTLWYSPILFGNMWMMLANMKPSNKKEEEEMKKSAGPAMGVAAITSVVTAYVLAHFISYFGLETPMEAVQLTFWIWLGFCGAIGLSDHMFTKNPIQLFLLNTSYRLVALVTMGVLIVVLS